MKQLPFNLFCIIGMLFLFGLSFFGKEYLSADVYLSGLFVIAVIIANKGNYNDKLS